VPVEVVAKPILGRDTDRPITEDGCPAERPGELNGSGGLLVEAKDRLVAAHEVTRVPDHGPEDVRRRALVGDLEEHVVEDVALMVSALEVGNELRELDRACQLMADVLECA
jgi:hypothetical protein